jgi:hypothetical protein
MTRRYVYSLFDGQCTVTGTKRVTVSEAKKLVKRCGPRCVVDLHTVDAQGRRWLQLVVHADGTTSKV